jgi:hypothetical protein
MYRGRDTEETGCIFDKTGCQMLEREAADVCVSKNKILLCVLFYGDVSNSNFAATNVKMIRERTLGEDLVKTWHCRNRGTSPDVAWSYRGKLLEIFLTYSIVCIPCNASCTGYNCSSNRRQ